MGKIFSAILGILDGIWGLFTSVAEAVVGLGLMPLVSAISVLLNVIINAVCELMQIMGAAIVKVLAIDIGSGNSLFELFVGEIDWIYPYMQAISWAFIFMFMVTALVKCMASSKTNETPLQIIGCSAMACVFSVGAPTFIIAFERVFKTFYTAIVSTQFSEELAFKGFATAATDYIRAGGLDNFFEKQMSALIGCFLLMLVIFAVAFMFIRFVTELVQRYIVLGALLMTSPLACCLFATKATRQSFFAWIKMVASTLLLLTINVFFLGAFFKALAGFSTNLETMKAMAPNAGSGTGELVLVFVYSILLVGILEVGQRIDSYMGTLGVSTAETGAMCVSTMMNTALAIGVIGAGSKSHHRGPVRKTASFVANRVQSHKDHVEAKREAAGVAGRTIRQHGAKNEATKHIQVNPETGLATAASVNKAVLNIAADTTIRGRQVGQTVKTEMQGVPSKFMSKLDANSCELTNGVITMKTIKDAQGRNATVSFVPKEDVEKFGWKGGRPVKLGDQEYIGFATGATKAEFLYDNPAARKELADKYGADSIEQLKVNGERSGVFRTVVKRKDGTHVVTEWAPASSYVPDAGLDAQCVTLGGMDYWKYKMSLPLEEGKTSEDNGHLVYRCHEPPPPDSAPKDGQHWFNRQFPAVGNLGYEYSGHSGDNIFIQRGDERYVMSPVASTIVKSTNPEHPTVIQREPAANGAEYFVLKVDDFKKETIDAVTEQRDEFSLSSPFARQIRPDEGPFIGSSSGYGEADTPNLVREAMVAKRNKKK